MDSTAPPQTTTTLDGGVLLLTLNRPDKLNAYTAQMGREITAAVQRAVELSESKYCSAQAMLSKAARITNKITILEA